MPRQPKPANIKIVKPQNGLPPGPISSPMNLEGVDLSSFGGDFSQEANGDHDIPSLPHTPPLSPRVLDRDTSSPFFGSLKKKISPEEQQRRGEEEKNRRKSGIGEDIRPGTSSVSKIYHLRKAPGSTPELSLVAGAGNGQKGAHEVSRKQVSETRPPLPSQQSEDPLLKRRPTFKNPLARTKSLNRRGMDIQLKMHGDEAIDQPPATAPLQPDADWPGAQPRTNVKGRERSRGKSAERPSSHDHEDSSVAPHSQASNSTSKNTFVSGGKNALSKAKTGGGNFFRNLANNPFRRGSSNHSEKTQPAVSDAEYEFRVINLPLIEQARITRISKQTHLCRDKTEFWMPALPWRCIDFLNTKCEVEGLYRVPGSTPQVKRWQRRFDTELDVDILKEDTYEVNEIASMLKAWLRDLPDDLFSRKQQDELAEKMQADNPDFKNMTMEPSAPQVLRDTLSQLQPYNYYVLFAVTCHLSLILKHKDQNRMDLPNLATCVSTSLRLERWLFYYLVGDWRGCWRGCLTEKPAEAVEKALWEKEHPEEAKVQASARAAAAAQQSQADSIRQSLKSEAQSRSLDPYTSAIDDVSSTTDERALSSAGASVASKPSSSHNDAKPAAFLDLTSRDPSKPLTYIPVGAKLNANGTLSSIATDVGRRPTTATAPVVGESVAARKPSEAESDLVDAHILGHIRSRSDLAAAPY